jgi:UDP-glucose 4-epimerase
VSGKNIMPAAVSKEVDRAMLGVPKQKGRGTTTILISGHRGFLGSAVARRLAAKSFRLVGIGLSNDSDRSSSVCHIEHEIQLPDPLLNVIVRELRPDCFIHCAGSADVGASFRDPPKDYRDNVVVTESILESLRNAAPKCRFVLLSSAAVYGNPRRLPVSEQDRCVPISPYGCHKLISEQVVDEYTADHGLKAAVLRIFSAYGSGLRRQVVYDLCTKLTERGASAIQVLGTGEESRDFIHADDIAAAVEHIVSNELQGIFNVASGKETHIAELAAMLKDHTGSHAEIMFTGESRTGDPLRWQADMTRLYETGFRPNISLKEGLKAYVDWFRLNAMATR